MGFYLKFMKLTEREKFIILVDNDKIYNSDAIILLEGDGTFRCQKAVELYKYGYSNKIIFSGGISDHAYGSFPVEDLLPTLKQLGLNENDLIIENLSRNTKEQADLVIKIAINKSWKNLILVASHYHQYRAYLTFLESIRISNIDIMLYNAPANDLEWFNHTGWGTRFELLESEFDKILDYQQLGHVASFEFAINYQIKKEKLSIGL